MMCLILVQLPRYVRVNLLKTSIQDVVARMESDGYILLDSGVTDLCHENQFCMDTHLFDVLVFHSSVCLVDHPLYLNHDIILQDKVHTP